MPKQYTGQQCSMSRTLEVIGERWTLLIVRDAFYGVRRFGDFASHLGMPRAVLSERLASLAGAGILAGATGSHGHTEYVLTDKGISLWPVVHSLMIWGDEHYSESGPRRVFRHAADDGALQADGSCAACGGRPAAAGLVITPGPGLRGTDQSDLVNAALAVPHRMLKPIRA